jgi:hypothetical protein
LTFLENELCKEAQGYLLGMPADIESYRQLTVGGEAFGEQPALAAARPGRQLCHVG